MHYSYNGNINREYNIVLRVAAKGGRSTFFDERYVRDGCSANPSLQLNFPWVPWDIEAGIVFLSEGDGGEYCSNDTSR